MKTNGHYSKSVLLAAVDTRVVDKIYSPPKIRGIRIIDNPFDDIVPRITAEEKRVQQRAKLQAQKEREDTERKRGAKKLAPVYLL